MFDRSYLQSPFSEYIKWIKTKIKYQRKYKYLRVGYMSKLFNTKFGKYNWVGNNVIMINSSIGDFSYISDGSVISETVMGKFCSIGPNVRTAPGKHPTHTFVTTHPSVYSNPSNLLKNFSNRNHYHYESEVVIGNDVWIGANAIILNGIKIGDGAIIGANSVIANDVQPYSIVVGSPGKLVKYRFDDNEIEFLLKFKWWNKGEEWIKSNVEKLLNIKKLTSQNISE